MVLQVRGLDLGVDRRERGRLPADNATVLLLRVRLPTNDDSLRAPELSHGDLRNCVSIDPRGGAEG